MTLPPVDSGATPFSETEIARWRAGRLSSTPAPGKPPVAGERLPVGSGSNAARPANQDEPEALDPDEPVMFVPDRLPAGPVPLVVLLHGATSNPADVLPIMEEQAQRRGFLVLAPKSIDYTWDVIVGGQFGPDVAALDSALSEVFSEFDVDPERVAVAGISDGASYALSLGLANGDLFKHVLAFSPGYFAPGHREGHPRIFISHGREDVVLPIEKTSWRVVSLLKRTGYQVDFREFTGGHEAPAEMVDAAMDSLTA
jgi:phospholipase/carboxylesterase